MASVLKCCKRFYIIFGRLVLSYDSNPKGILFPESHVLLESTSSKFTPRCMALLLDLQVSYIALLLWSILRVVFRSNFLSTVSYL